MSGHSLGDLEGPSRLDVTLVRRGLARSRAQAQALIASGGVMVDGTIATKPSTRVVGSHQVAVAIPEPWVGRAAYKLLGALDVFQGQGLAIAGRRCLDVGASTGGFTQVLLHHGAREVVALDVGHGQLAAQVAEDPRVLERSGTTVRGLTATEIGGAVEVLVADLSFISLTLVMSEFAGLLLPGGYAVVLVKPQFEVGRERLGHGGVVRSTHERERAVGAVVESARTHGLHVRGLEPSPIDGGTGNREYLLWLANGPQGAWEWQAVRTRAHQIIHDPQEQPT